MHVSTSNPGLAPMTHDDGRPVLVALAVCCAVPMIGIVVLTSVLGVALGWAAAAAVGLVAAGVCVAVTVQHQRGSHHHNVGETHVHHDA